MKSSAANHGFLEFVYDFYKTMKLNEINLVYEGEITHQITKAFTSLAESNMERDEESNAVQRKVFHVMVECLQNISKHAENSGAFNIPLDGRGIFMVCKEEEAYRVTTGNIISNKRVDTFKEFIEHVNSLDKEDLKALYKKQIKEGRLSDKGGAGLGIIDIVRKTGFPIEFHLRRVDDESSFILLISTIARN